MMIIRKGGKAKGEIRKREGGRKKNKEKGEGRKSGHA
jgi:hypothetical protein